MHACISGWCMTAGRAVAIGDIYLDDRIPHDAYRPTFVRSLAMAPVRQDDPIAALGAYWADARTVSAQELELLQTVANAATLAIAYVQVQGGAGPAQDRGHGKSLQDREREHRGRNMMAVVQSIVRRSLADQPERAAAIIRRIDALLANDGMLAADGNGAGATVAAVLTSELEPYGLSRIDLIGGEVDLLAERAQALSIVAHEWATNAAKHGAFSVPEWRLLVSWLAAGGELRLTWQELDGPANTGPAAPGFGTYLVQRLLEGMGGVLDTQLRPAGIFHELRIPLSGDDAAPAEHRPDRQRPETGGGPGPAADA